MPASYPAEFRHRAIALVGARWSVTKTAANLDVTMTTFYNWVRQDCIDRGEIVGVSNKESKELVRTRQRIRELKSEVEIQRRANRMLGKDVLRPTGSTR
jgi:transposase